MPTEIKTVKTNLIAIILFCLIAPMVNAQTDTVDVKPFQRYWTKPRVVPKVGFGVQDTGFGELGVQLHQIFVHPLSLASAGPYITLDGVFLQSDEIILGPKIGYELTAGLLGLAADVTYYTDLERESLMVTPKAGISLFGYVDLFYGRNIALSDDRFKSISDNRFSLIFNLNPDYHNIREATRKNRKNR
jgi:hypothetical protein